MPKRMTSAAVRELALSIEAPPDIHPNRLDLTFNARLEDDAWGLAWFDGLVPRPAFAWFVNIKDGHAVSKIIREEGALWNAKQRLEKAADAVAEAAAVEEASDTSDPGDGSPPRKNSKRKSSGTSSRKTKPPKLVN